MHGDLYNGVIFNRRYQTREPNEHQPRPSGLLIYPCYQQRRQQFHSNVYTSHDASPSGCESPSGSSGSGSENVNKRWEATEVKSAYKDHQDNPNNSKSSKGKNSVWENIFDTFSEHRAL